MSGDDFDRMFAPAAVSTPPSFAKRIRPDDADVRDCAPAETTVGAGDYKPYGFVPAGVGEACDIRRWLDHTDTAEGIEFQYRFLMEIAYVGEEQLRLFLPDCLVVIEGERLRDLRKRLARRQVTFIQQYSPRIWPGGRQQGEPAILQIEIVRGGSPRPRRDG